MRVDRNGPDGVSAFGPARLWPLVVAAYAVVGPTSAGPPPAAVG